MNSWLAFGAMSGITRTKIMPSFSITGAFACAAARTSTSVAAR